MKRYCLFIIILLNCSTCLLGQTSDSLSLVRVDALIHNISIAEPRLNNEIDLSVGKLPLSELLRYVAKVSGVNLNVKGGDSVMITCNFSRSKVSDLLRFVCREYNMRIEVAGNIISVFQLPPVPMVYKEPIVNYEPQTKMLSYDLQNDRLVDVVKKIGLCTGVNIVLPQTMYQTIVSGFIRNASFDEAIVSLAKINGFQIGKNKHGLWEIVYGQSTGSQQLLSEFMADNLQVDSIGLITAQLNRCNVTDIIVEICRRKGVNYFFINPVTIETGVFVKDISFDSFLDMVFTDTDFSYYTDKGIYFFGNSAQERELTAVQIIPLKFRSVDKIDTVIPESLKKGLQVNLFADLNSIVVSGNRSRVSRIISFVDSIDKPVPLITIDIIIADSKKSTNMETGIGMGVGKAPVATSGTISPGIDMTIGASTVNSLINSFNGFGAVNIGKVTPEFYMSLKFLEDNGDVELQSTPKLSTLNGHQASLTSGETRYYKEVTSNFIGTQNPIQSESFVWKSVEANLNIKIIPYVSTDNHITLDIEIEQSEFTAKEEKTAPPGKVTRSFKSIIKVQNEDMVLLGGIDRNSKEKGATGLPFLSRVPVLKWIFGQSKNNKNETKLNVFIKPTVIK